MICATEKLLLVKILFEEVSVKLVFKAGREGLRWRAKGREFQIWTTEKQKYDRHAVFF